MRSPLRLIRPLVRAVVTLVMIGIAAVLMVAVWHTYMIAPWTRDGRVLAEVVDIAPEIPGTIVSVPVHDNQFVHKGDVLFELDPVRFRLAIAAGPGGRRTGNAAVAPGQSRCPPPAGVERRRVRRGTGAVRDPPPRWRRRIWTRRGRRSMSRT